MTAILTLWPRLVFVLVRAPGSTFTPRRHHDVPCDFDEFRCHEIASNQNVAHNVQFLNSNSIGIRVCHSLRSPRGGSDAMRHASVVARMCRTMLLRISKCSTHDRVQCGVDALRRIASRHCKTVADLLRTLCRCLPVLDALQAVVRFLVARYRSDFSHTQRVVCGQSC